MEETLGKDLRRTLEETVKGTEQCPTFLQDFFHTFLLNSFQLVKLRKTQTKTRKTLGKGKLGIGFCVSAPSVLNPVIWPNCVHSRNVKFLEMRLGTFAKCGLKRWAIDVAPEPSPKVAIFFVFLYLLLAPERKVEIAETWNCSQMNQGFKANLASTQADTCSINPKVPELHSRSFFSRFSGEELIGLFSCVQYMHTSTWDGDCKLERKCFFSELLRLRCRFWRIYKRLISLWWTTQQCVR